MSRNYLNSQAFRDHDNSWDGRRWLAPPNTHPNPLSGYSEDYADPDDCADCGGTDCHRCGRDEA